MTPEQIPDITLDKGLQEECHLAVKSMLQRKRFTVTELSSEIEEIVYHAMLRGMQSGFGYGWNLGQRKLLEDQKKWRG